MARWLRECDGHRPGSRLSAVQRQAGVAHKQPSGTPPSTDVLTSRGICVVGPQGTRLSVVLQKRRSCCNRHFRQSLSEPVMALCPRDDRAHVVRADAMPIGGSPDHSPALAAAQHTNGLRASRNGQVPVGLGDLGIEGDRQGAVASILIRAIGAWSAGIATCAAATSCSRLRSENPPLASHSDDLSRAVQADAVHQARNRKVGNPCPRLATAGSDRQAGEQGVVGWR